MRYAQPSDGDGVPRDSFTAAAYSLTSPVAYRPGRASLYGCTKTLPSMYGMVHGPPGMPLIGVAAGSGKKDASVRL